ncbi:hypothetical protein [Enterococcus cecorum]|uniref:Uncharacterized protein n=2 Tax=Enterococcus cecorum TaxID=44008 RepID=S1RNN7_9ENTE|nr:hypothetical protein [Enterococcus cecorum]EOX18137.1 hypothetical protein I567_02099 [Enterococcus cecorum DSM 20682 = ATCC 43198]ESK62268.1 hypothetical protein OMO_00518 [Enterococcus cecorum DSM 20682 = ATCC 43198]NME48797.1 hypothetical protein [Enterococcus cecorum]OJG34615.1 hypothetical protein RT42_GL000020 [Enterococcus cecorum DSM 20682 = ATCC 43198]CAI3259534.1 hypothetical protein CIRMBP1204_00116 [Enterococcus cecorum]
MDKKILKIIITLLLMVSVSVICIFGYNYSQRHTDTQSKDVIENFVENVNQQYDQVNKKVATGYLNKEKIFLAKDLDQKKLDDIQQSINNFENEYNAALANLKSLNSDDLASYQSQVQAVKDKVNQLLTNFQSLQKKFASQKAINGLFEHPFLTGDKQNKEVLITASLKQADFDQVKKANYTKDAKDDYQKALNQGLDIAEGQIKAVTQAKDLYNQLYKDQTVTEQANQASLDQVKQLIGQIKNPKIRDSFTEGLQAIEAMVQAQATTQTETTTASATNTDGTMNQDTTIYDNTTPNYNYGGNNTSNYNPSAGNGTNTGGTGNQNNQGQQTPGNQDTGADTGTGSSEEPTPSTPDPETPQNDNEFIGENGGNFTWNE